MCCFATSNCLLSDLVATFISNCRLNLNIATVLKLVFQQCVYYFYVTKVMCSFTVKLHKKDKTVDNH